MFFPGLFFILFSHFCVGVEVLGLGLRLGFLGWDFQLIVLRPVVWGFYIRIE